MDRNIQDYKFIRQLQSLPYIEEIWLFGSRAREDHQERSDIDLAVICPYANNPDWENIMNIIEDADTLLKIDCVRFDKKHINRELYKNILKDRKIIYVKDKDQA